MGAIPEFGPVPHRLDEVEISVRFKDDGGLAVHAYGRAVSKRTSLWTIQHNPQDLTGPGDAAERVHQLVLVTCQHRPSTLERLQWSMAGGLQQDALFPF